MNSISQTANAVQMPTPNSKLEAALEHARNGFAVFPLRPNTKVPCIENWQNVATNDKDQIERWWRAVPDRNIGIYAGGMLVVDIDPGKGGTESITRLMQEHQLIEELPVSLASRTWSGGTHMFYRLPPHTAISNSVEHVGPGIDIRTEGGFVVAPGSVIEGKIYEWKAGYAPRDQDIAVAPQWLIDRCKDAPKRRTRASGQRIIDEDAIALELAERHLQRHAPDAIEGGRNNTAFALAANLYDFGITEETCLSLMLEWNEGWCHPALDHDELSTIVWSAAKNRNNAIGAKHPQAPGFDAVVIDATKAPIGRQQPRIFSESFAEAAERALEQSNEPLIEGLLDRQAMSVWYGESNSGKTFVVLDAAWHIAAGRPWANRATHQGLVVYVATEGGGGIRKRFRALENRYPDAGDVPLHLVPCPVDLLRRNSDLVELVAAVKTIETRSSQKAELVVIDTLSRAMPGGDENSPQDMTAFVGNLDSLRRQVGAHIAVIHHTGKDKARGARGHSSLRAATDTEIEIGDQKLSVTKQRDMDGDTCLEFRLQSVRLGFTAAGKHATSCNVDVYEVGKAPKDRKPLTARSEQFLAELEKELVNACGDDTGNIYGHRFTTQTAIKCAKRVLGGNARAHSSARRETDRMMRELRNFDRVDFVERGQWVLIDARNAQNAQLQTSTQCANARGSIDPRIAGDQGFWSKISASAEAA